MQQAVLERLLDRVQSQPPVQQVSHIPQLEGETNYEDWKVSVTSHLKAARLIEYIENDVPKPLDPSKITGWESNRSSCYNAIWNCTHKVHRRLKHNNYKPDDDPYKLWRTITNTFGVVDTRNALPAQAKLATLDRTSYSSTSAMLDKFFLLRTRLNTYRTVTDEESASYLLWSLRTSHSQLYEQLVCTKPSLDTMLAELNQLQSAEESNLVFLAGNGTQGAPHNQTSSGRPYKKGPKRRDRPLCNLCEKNHAGTICWWVYPETLPPSYHRYEEISKAIHAWRATEEGKRLVKKAPKSPLLPKSATADSGITKTFEVDDPKPGTSAAGIFGSSNFMTLIRPSQPDRPYAPQNRKVHGVSYTLLNAAVASEATEDPIQRDDICWDWGCQQTTFNDPKWFTELDTSTQEGTLTGIGGTVAWEGTGTVQFHAVDPDDRSKKVLWTVRNVKYMPSLPINLISAGIYQQRGYDYDFRTRSIVNSKDGFRIAGITWRHKLAFVDIAKPTKDEPITVPIATALNCLEIASKTRPSLQQMHERLGHASKERVIRASKRAGIRFSRREIEAFHCDACALGKSTELISRTPIQQHNIPGQFFADLIEIKPPARGMHKYALHLIEKHTGYHWIRGLRSKTGPEVMKALYDFFNLWERQTGYAARVLHADAGREFINFVVKSEIEARGMILEVTAPDTPAQNGPAERAGRVIIEAARTMRIAAGIPEDLWLYTLKTAVDTINLLPTSSNPDHISPHEALAKALGMPKTAPYIKHLRTYGCTAYVHRKGILRPNRANKMEPRAVKGKLIGYDGLHGHIYHIWLPKVDKVVRVRDVRFWEGEANTQDRPQDEDATEYEAIIDDPAMISTPTARETHPTPLVPSTQEENHQITSRALEKQVHFEEELTGIPTPPEEPGYDDPEPIMAPQQPPEEEQPTEPMQAPLTPPNDPIHEATPLDEAIATDFDLPFTSQAWEEPQNELLEAEGLDEAKGGDDPVTADEDELPTIIVAQEASLPSSRDLPQLPPSQEQPRPRKKRQKAPLPPPSDRQTRGSSQDYVRLSRGMLTLREGAVYPEESINAPVQPPTLVLTALAAKSFTSITVPKNLRQAREQENYTSSWLPAMRKQLESLQSREVWELVEQP